MMKCCTHHEESSSVVVLLKELVFAFAGFVGDDFAIIAELSSAFLLCQVVESFDFSLLPLHPAKKHHSLLPQPPLCVQEVTVTTVQIDVANS